MVQNAAQASKEIAQVFAALKKGLHDRDASAVTALYAPDAPLFDLAPPLSGTPDEAGLALWLSSWSAPMQSETSDVEIKVSGDLAVSHGLTHMQSVTNKGEKAEWWMRSTIVLERREGQWLIIHEHNSVPFYMDGSDRAALDLKPE